MRYNGPAATVPVIRGLTGERILGAILFEQTMDREIEGRGSADAGLVGVVGEVKTKGGKRIHIYLPLVAMQADAPAARVDEAATKMGRDLYQRAKKTCEIYPLSEISDAPAQ